jgi:hypothetical protein
MLFSCPSATLIARYASKHIEPAPINLYNAPHIPEEPYLMSALTPASEVILRHSDDFIGRRVLFAGDLQDDLPADFDAESVRVHTNQYHHWQMLNASMKGRAVWSGRGCRVYRVERYACLLLAKEQTGSQVPAFQPAFPATCRH